MRLSIIIPTYNGQALLQKHLPSLLAADGVGDAELIISDDGSTDGTSEWLAAHVPQARIVRQDTNQGFSRACNAAIAASVGDVFILLNNDVDVQPGFLAPLLRPLDADPNVFAVNASILIPGQDNLDEGEKRGAFHHGLFYVDVVRDPLQRATQTAPTLYATACAAAYRRVMVDALGGFDPLYSPAYWEDADLSYRAWKRGWIVLYEPGSVVYHQHETTTARLPARYLATLRARNGFLFVWKNITDRCWIASHLLFAPIVALYHLLRDRDPSLLRGLFAAARLWPQVSARRAGEKRAAHVPDRQIIQRLACGSWADAQRALAPSLPASPLSAGHVSSGETAAP